MLPDLVCVVLWLQNEDEAAVMQAKEEKAKKLIQDNTKAKSKMTKAERAMKEKEKKEKVRSSVLGLQDQA